MHQRYAPPLTLQPSLRNPPGPSLIHRKSLDSLPWHLLFHSEGANQMRMRSPQVENVFVFQKPLGLSELKPG